jgi:hypothetical protein
VSNDVAPQVATIAVPDVAGVHWYTRSGEAPVTAQVPANALVPLVVPVNVPPSGGTGIGLQGPGEAVATGWDVTVGTGVEVRVVVGGSGVTVADGVARGVAVRVADAVATAVGVGVAVRTGVAVRVAVGAAPLGGVTVNVKVPFAPSKPSTTMKAVCPAVTLSDARDA